MLKRDAKEAAAIVEHMLDALLSTAADKGRPGSDLRTACGDLRVSAVFLLQTNAIAGPLADCFETARLAGASLVGMAHVRSIIVAERPVSLPAILMMEGGLLFCLATEGRIIATMQFESREDVQQVKLDMTSAFNDAEEIAADAMESSTYQALVALHAAVTAHLVETARPLPRMLQFKFAQPLTTLAIAYKLYDDAGRADELRNENKVVHPAFTRPSGRALSA